MATRQMKMPAKSELAEQEVGVIPSQGKRPERGRYLLQVDRQTKGSYTTSEAAQSAAQAIKTGYPIVQVSCMTASSTHNRSIGHFFLTDLLASTMANNPIASDWVSGIDNLSQNACAFD